MPPCGSLSAFRKPATPKDRKALVGLWIPDDSSRHTIEFRDNGVFDFVYDPGPIRTVLRIKWSLDTKGKVDIRQDDGSGGACIRSATTPTVLMPKAFTKSP